MKTKNKKIKKSSTLITTINENHNWKSKIVKKLSVIKLKSYKVNFCFYSSFLVDESSKAIL